MSPPGWFVRWSQRPVYRGDLLVVAEVVFFAYGAVYWGFWGRVFAAFALLACARIWWRWWRRR